MTMTLILQQHARRILACSNKSSLFRSYGTLWSPEANQTLQSWIKVPIDQKAQIVPVLDQWQQQGNPLYMRGLIKNLRDSNRFSQALEASKWKGEKKMCNLFAKDFAARFHLIETVLGLEEAEKFFKSIPANMRDLSTLYTKSEKTLDKAESTFKKMRELGFLSKPSPFNSMMSLYSQLGKRNMVDKLLYEMEENEVQPDNITASNVLKAYAAVSDIKAMHMLRMWVDEKGLKLERDTIVEMAKAYIRVCSKMYGGSAREMMCTLWDKCKEGYRTVISSLSKLDDVEGAEDIYGVLKKDEDEVRELVTKKTMMLLHVLNLLLLVVTLSLPFFVCPPNLSIPLVVLSVMLTHISITRLLRSLIFFQERE